MDHRLIGIAVGIALGAAGGGYALGGYATGGTQAALPAENVDPTAFWRQESGPPTETPQSLVQEAAAPEHYVCHGCGPTLAERQARQAWGGGPPAVSYDAPQDVYPQSGL